MFISNVPGPTEEQCSETRKASRGSHEAFHELSRRRPTFPPSCPGSIIGAGGLNFRVRDGNGCFPSAIATGNLSRSRPVCDASGIPGMNDDEFPDPGKLLFSQNPPCHKIVEFLIWSVLSDTASKDRRDAREPSQFLQASLVDVHLRVGGHSHGGIWGFRRQRTRLPSANLGRGNPRHPGQDQCDSGADQKESASHGQIRIAIGVSTLLPVFMICKKKYGVKPHGRLVPVS